MSILSDLASSLTGRVESAYLVIKDFRATQGGGMDAGGVLKNTQAALSGADSLVSSIVGDTDKRFKVQFNPSELQIYATSLPIYKPDAQHKEGAPVKTGGDAVLKPTVEMTVRLMFDQVNKYDSFMGDKFALSLSTSAMNLASAIGQAKGKVWTVRTEVEGILASLRNKYTRNITFQWSTFSFTGQLVNVSARYTMFSVSGRPVRAQVTLRLRQELDPNLLKSWYDDFDSAFGGESVLTNAEGPAQYVSNLLNLGL